MLYITSWLDNLCVANDEFVTTQIAYTFTSSVYITCGVVSAPVDVQIISSNCKIKKKSIRTRFNRYVELVQKMKIHVEKHHLST